MELGVSQFSYFLIFFYFFFKNTYNLYFFLAIILKIIHNFCSLMFALAF